MIDEKRYNRWLNFANVICNNKEQAKDTLQEFCVNILEKQIPEERLNDNYVFISLRNTFLTLNKVNSRYTDPIKNEQTYEEEDHELIYSDMQSKHKVIEEVIQSLRPYEKQLYVLHFIYGISQREIARESGIGIGPIFKRIKKIKTKINEKYKKEKGE